MSDFWPHGAVAQRYGVLRPEGYSERAIFIIDERGIIQYIDIHDFDHQPDNEVIFRELRRLNPEAARRERASAANPVEQAHPGGIVLYCTRWCPSCRKARAWLEERGLQYTLIDVDFDPHAAAKVRGWANGNLTTPTFDFHGMVVVDFDLERLEETLEKFQRKRESGML